MQSQGSVPAILSTRLPAVQEAAMLYAHGREQEAADVLLQSIDAGESPAAWTLLFDLHRARGDWRAFEDLSARFERAFGKPGPQWVNEDTLARLPSELQRGGQGFFELAGPLDGLQVDMMSRLHARAAEHATVHLDLARVTDLNATGAAQLADALSALAANGAGVLFTGAEHLVRLVRTAARGNGSETAYWRLLLELNRLRGMRLEFERAALEFALAAGVSPPEWDPVILPMIAAPDVQEKRDEPRYHATPEVFYLVGTMNGARDAQLLALERFAGKREYVNLNLSQLARLDFACATRLVELVNGLSASGKTVRLIRPNALVATLLASFALAPAVVLLTR